MSTDNFTVLSARVTNAAAGIQKYFSTTASLVLAGTTYTPAQLSALLTAFANAVTALAALHAQLKGNAATVRGHRSQILQVLRALQGYVENLYGSDPVKLADFGFKPKKVGVESAATKASSAAKAKATRDAKKSALATVTKPASPAPANGITLAKA